MYGDFGIGSTEVTVFLVIATVVWGLRVLTSITKTPGLNDQRRIQ
jgi:hypothetical protein